MVRVVRLERTVSWSQTRRDTNFAIPGYSISAIIPRRGRKSKIFLSVVIPVVKAAFVPLSATGESPANAGVARLCGVSPHPIPDTATALPNQARYQLRYTRILFQYTTAAGGREEKILVYINNVESIIKCRRNRYGFSCIIFLSEGRRKEVKTLNGYSYLTLEQRREIERMYAEGERVVDIAARLKRSAAAIYEELKRGYTGEFDGYARPKYSADLAQATVQENFRRRGNRRGANC